LPNAPAPSRAVGLSDRRPYLYSFRPNSGVAWPAPSCQPPKCWPTNHNNLDSANGRQVLELLLTLNRQQGATLVLVTHDREFADHATRIITLKDGLIVADERKSPA
jgi:hypothetical protein